MNLSKILIGATLVVSSVTTLFAGTESLYPFGQVCPAYFFIPTLTPQPGSGGWFGYIARAPFINFTATCQGKLSATSPWSTIPFYPSWTPPPPPAGRYYPDGARPYYEFYVGNTSPSVSKVVIVGEGDGFIHPSLGHCDNLLWYSVNGGPWTFISDDDAINGTVTQQFGVLATIQPNSNIGFRVSMYNPNDDREQFFGISFYNGDEAGGLVHLKVPGSPSISN